MTALLARLRDWLTASTTDCCPTCGRTRPNPRCTTCEDR